tara:strand:- start:1728 stop:2144 length:417 start_codon:yes stop_codon:yes gene_type:complete
MKVLKGYIFSRKLLNGDYVTQKTQNLVIRESCKLKNFQLELSSAEYIMENSYLVLNNLIKNLKNYDGVAFFSLFQLPALENKRSEFYNTFLKKRKLMYFCNEKIILSSFKGVINVENIINISKILHLSPNKKDLENIL